MAEAVEWIARITTVVMEMVLPGIGGHWLDQRWGTNYLALVGFALGFAIGLFHLIRMARESARPGSGNRGDASAGNAEKGTGDKRTAGEGTAERDAGKSQSPHEGDRRNGIPD